jgi:hypothetical protein
MKIGRSLKDLAIEIQRQMHEKKDFLAPTSKLSFEVAGMATGLNANDVPVITDRPQLRIDGQGSFGLKPTMVTQLGQYLDIPVQYLRRCEGLHPELFAQSLNTWLQHKHEQRFVRTLDGDARALLSDRYATLDNHDLLEQVFPVLQDLGVKIVSCEITDTKLYIQAVNERFQAEVTRGDVVQAGVIISNSEVGAGSLRISPLVYRLVCTNGLVVPDRQLRKHHVGRSIMPENGDGVWEILSEDARRKTSEAVWAQVRDVTASALTEALFHQVVDQMRDAKQQAIPVEDMVQVVEHTASRYGLGKGEQSSVLNHLIRDGDFSRYGLLNAVTRSAQDVESYDRAVELEELGGRILSINRQDWKSLAG